MTEATELKKEFKTATKLKKEFKTATKLKKEKKTEATGSTSPSLNSRFLRTSESAAMAIDANVWSLQIAEVKLKRR